MINDVSKAFSIAVDNAIMAKGEKGIREVVTQYMFGECKLFKEVWGHLEEEAKLNFVSRFISNVKASYQADGRSGVFVYIQNFEKQGVVV